MKFHVCYASVLHPFLDEFVIVYLYDILIFRKTREEYILHGNRVLDTSLVYLGHIVGGGAFRIDPSKVEAIVNWPTPKSIT